jgi:flagellar motor protein MotB
MATFQPVRAIAAAFFLIPFSVAAFAGAVSENLLFLQADGETLPVAVNDSAAGRAMNRRVEPKHLDD